MIEYKRIIWLGMVIVFSLIFFQNLYLLQPSFSGVMSVSDYLTWHILFEFISIVISFCVFVLPYHAYKQNHNLRGLFIANAFLIMAVIDTFHTLSYQGMPDFLIANTDSNRATTFWIIARLIGSAGIAFGSLIRQNRESKVNRNVFLAVSVLISIAVLTVVTYFPGFVPAMYVEGVGITQIKRILEYVIIAFLCLAGILYLRQYVKNRDNLDLLFAVAVTIGIFSEAAFVSYSSVYDIYNYIGHVYKSISYFIFFRIVFIQYIERPYLALYNAQIELKEYSGDLSRLVSVRTKDLQAANRELNKLNHKLLEDLDYARDIQKAILPDKLPNNDQATFYAKYYPAERVSGDFYNMFRLDENKIGMYIGDVSGHGVPAAMLTVFLNQTIQTTRELDENRTEIIKPSKVLKHLYEVFNKVSFRDEVYILVLYAIYDIRTRELEYASAGLNVQPILVKKNGEVSELEIKGLPICNLMDIVKAEYTDNTVRLESGERVFFYTDGLTELGNRKTGESFTAARLERLLGENNDKSCPELFELMDKIIRSFTMGGGLRDDITFFILQAGS